VEDRKDYDDVGFDREVHRIGKATEESAPDPRLEVSYALLSFLQKL